MHVSDLQQCCSASCSGSLPQPLGDRIPYVHLGSGSHEHVDVTMGYLEVRAIEGARFVVGNPYPDGRRELVVGSADDEYGAFPLPKPRPVVEALRRERPRLGPSEHMLGLSNRNPIEGK